MLKTMKEFTGFEINGYAADESGFADLTKQNKKSDDAHQNVSNGLILKNHEGKGVAGVSNDDHPPFQLTLGKAFEGGIHPSIKETPFCNSQIILKKQPKDKLQLINVTKQLNGLNKKIKRVKNIGPLKA